MTVADLYTSLAKPHQQRYVCFIFQTKLKVETDVDGAAGDKDSDTEKENEDNADKNDDDSSSDETIINEDVPAPSPGEQYSLKLLIYCKVWVGE